MCLHRVGYFPRRDKIGFAVLGFLRGQFKHLARHSFCLETQTALAGGVAVEMPDGKPASFAACLVCEIQFEVSAFPPVLSV